MLIFNYVPAFLHGGDRCMFEFRLILDVSLFHRRYSSSLGVWGNSYKIGIEFGTTDNNSRTYSKFIKLRVPESLQ